MRRPLFLVALAAALVLGLAACGGSKKTDGVKVSLGSEAGSFPAWQLTVSPKGAVQSEGAPPVKLTTLTSAQETQLSKLVRDGLGSVKARVCPHVPVDQPTYFITALRKTIAVRGTCEPAFTKLWQAVTSALGLNQ